MYLYRTGLEKALVKVLINGNTSLCYSPQAGRMADKRDDRIKLSLDAALQADIHSVCAALGADVATVVSVYLVELLHGHHRPIDYAARLEWFQRYRAGKVTAGDIMERLNIDSRQMLDHLMQAYQG